MNKESLTLLSTTNQDSGPSRQPNGDKHRQQMALASLFSSLSSLVHNQRVCNQQQQHHSQTAAPVSNLHQDASDPLSIQSVMAAALVQQQQLVVQSQLHQHTSGNSGDQSSIFSGQTTGQDMQSGQISQQQVQQQRINYCTICNKELCNKYFMKTHMLKMHGISLEMEQPEASTEPEEEHQGRNEAGSADSSDEDDKRLSECSSTNLTCSSAGKGPQPQPKKKAGGSVSAGHKLANRKQTGSGKQTTSVLNGFAGNSMGGVVCDICNKELCSKYFLKVHKQNTHGIATDYQDAGQFIYPFSGPMVGPSPFLMHSAIEANMAQPNTPTLFGVDGQQPVEEETEVGKRPAKRVRLTKQCANENGSGTTQMASGDSAHDGRADRQLEAAFYRLITQQQQQLPPTATGPALTTAANPLGAFMCFGAMGPSAGPFGPSGLSAAMIVDNILKNQHLFNRGGQKQQWPAAKTGTDRNNNQECKQVSSGSGRGGQKGCAGSSKYFSHYTEACPMCERRFKSIKWLKTHMMNDHKQEIGAYMQMMMQQYLYSSKSQQMAAMATAMAPFEQQQQPAISLLDRCLNLSSTFQQQASVITDTARSQPQPGRWSCSEPLKSWQKQQQLAEMEDLIIDARCKRESLSPFGDSLHRISPSPAPSRPELNYVSDSNARLLCGLNFELNNQDGAGQTHSELLSRALREEGSGDSDGSAQPIKATDT